jgi:hypothetical protein
MFNFTVESSGTWLASAAFLSPTCSTLRLCWLPSNSYSRARTIEDRWEIVVLATRCSVSNLTSSRYQVKPSNRVYMLSTSWDMCTSCIPDAISDFRLPITRDGICLIIVGIIDHMKIGIAAETALISGLQRPPYWIFDSRLHMTVFLLLTLFWSTPKAQVLPLKLHWYLVYLLR